MDIPIIKEQTTDIEIIINVPKMLAFLNSLLPPRVSFIKTAIVSIPANEIIIHDAAEIIDQISPLNPHSFRGFKNSHVNVLDNWPEVMNGSVINRQPNIKMAANIKEANPPTFESIFNDFAPNFEIYDEIQKIIIEHNDNIIDEILVALSSEMSNHSKSSLASKSKAFCPVIKNPKEIISKGAIVAKKNKFEKNVDQLAKKPIFLPIAYVTQLPTPASEPFKSFMLANSLDNNANGIA